jgi:hypothetical protein
MTSYEEWEAKRRYRIVRVNRGNWPANGRREIVASGLTLDEARAQADELSKAERAAHPELASWTRDLFIRELETPPWKASR